MIIKFKDNKKKGFWEGRYVHERAEVIHSISETRSPDPDKTPRIYDEDKTPVQKYVATQVSNNMGWDDLETGEFANQDTPQARYNVTTGEFEELKLEPEKVKSKKSIEKISKNVEQQDIENWAKTLGLNEEEKKAMTEAFNILLGFQEVAAAVLPKEKLNNAQRTMMRQIKAFYKAFLTTLTNGPSFEFIADLRNAEKGLRFLSEELGTESGREMGEKLDKLRALIPKILSRTVARPGEFEEMSLMEFTDVADWRISQLDKVAKNLGAVNEEVVHAITFFDVGGWEKGGSSENLYKGLTSLRDLITMTEHYLKDNRVGIEEYIDLEWRAKYIQKNLKAVLTSDEITDFQRKLFGKLQGLLGEMQKEVAEVISKKKVPEVQWQPYAEWSPLGVDWGARAAAILRNQDQDNE